MESRIYGVETEYALSLETKDRKLQSRLDPGKLFDRLEASVLERHLSLDGDSFGRSAESEGHGIEIREGRFLKNGARFYYDTGHIEWATPEASSARQAALYELSGERTLAEAAQSMDLPGDTRLLIVKNNLDYVRQRTYGCHENYRARRVVSRRKDIFPLLIQKLVPFLVTRQIFCGAGRIGSSNEDAPQVGFQISQRADFISQVASDNTRSDRAILNQRDESLSNDSRFQRLHLILGDSNRSPFSSILKLGTTGLVLQMIEREVLTDVPALADPVQALKETSRDLTFRQPLRLEDGRRLSARQIQEIYYEKAQRYFSGRGGDEAQDILLMWGSVLTDLESDPMLLSNRVDWAIKLRYLLQPHLERADCSWPDVAAWSRVIESLERERHTSGPLTERHFSQYRFLLDQDGLNWNDYENQRRLYFDLRERDLRYHDIDSKRGLFSLLQGTLGLPTEFEDSEIGVAQREPPPDTRARIRAQVIEWAHQNGSQDSVMLDWGRVNFAAEGRVVPLDDPFALSQPELDELLCAGPRPAQPGSRGPSRSPLSESRTRVPEIRILGETELPPRLFQRLRRRLVGLVKKALGIR
ncbi:MAG: proteasome accessory factor PafA2 family protein [Acidobacteriota bacterium]